jgi:hypothetical protein
MSTACYRGFICHYAVIDDRLVLQSLEIGLADGPLDLTNVSPDQNGHAGSWRYRGLSIPVEFTGRLLVAKDVMDGAPYLHMGFWPAWMFTDVRELGFDRGRLMSAVDRSDELAAVRNRLGSDGARPSPGESTVDWIDRTFSLTFEYSWPSTEP